MTSRNHIFLRLNVRPSEERARFTDLIRVNGVSLTILRGRVTADSAVLDVMLDGSQVDVERALRLYEERGISCEPIGIDRLREIAGMRRLVEKLRARETVGATAAV